MGDTGETSAARWCGGDGRWYEGDPPNGWWQANDGRWYPPRPPAPPSQAPWTIPVTPPQHVPGQPEPASGASGFGGQVGMAYRRWPTWAQITVPTLGVVMAVFMLLAVVGALVGPQADVQTTSADRETTTTTRERDATSTTHATTTTTAVTTTTTTAPPPPPTTAAPPPPPPTEPPPPPAPAPAPAPAPGGGCHPSYTPCVPIASDVDCAGGSGDGPAYVDGPIQVIGPDEYDLDRDGDGIACES